MRIVSQRIIFAGKQLVDVGLGYSWIAHNNGISGNISEALAGWMDKASDAADKVKAGQRIYKTNEVAGNDLIELQSHSLGVHDPEAEKLFTKGLAAPKPFEEDAIPNADDEKSQSVKGRRQVGVKDLEKEKELA